MSGADRVCGIADDLHIFPVDDGRVGDTAGRDGSVDKVWIQNLHMRGASTGVGSLDQLLRRVTYIRVTITYTVIDPWGVRSGQVFLNTVELDIRQKISRVRSRLSVVQPPQVVGGEVGDGDRFAYTKKLEAQRFTRNYVP